jgi:hypothetical protein
LLDAEFYSLCCVEEEFSEVHIQPSCIPSSLSRAEKRPFPRPSTGETQEPSSRPWWGRSAGYNDTDMLIELLYFGGCPTYRHAEEDVRRALAETGVEAEVNLVEVNSDEEARRLAFPGSPTVRIDGRDPFPVPERGEGGLACRVYATPEGMKGTPTAAMIREVLGSGNEPPKGKPLTPGDEELVELGGVFGLPFRTLLSREVRRFVRVWTQTLLSPLLTSALYILVFGYGLGSRIREAAGVP